MDPSEVPVFRERLLLLRRRRDMTQQELAEKTKLYKTDISKYERGKALPSVPRLVSLAQALGATPDMLLGYREVE